MISVAFASLAMVLYLTSSLLLVHRLNQNLVITQGLVNAPAILAWLALGLHAAYTVLVFQEQQGFNFSFFNTASVVAMIVALLLQMAAFSKPVEKLGIAVFPIAAAMLCLELNFDDKPQALSTHNWAMTGHILASIIAFSLLNIAALQAALLAIQDQQLKSHPPKRFIQSLPSLQAMESLLFQMLGAGVFFLTLSLTSGFVFVEDLFAQHLAHKTVLSILAWLIFSGLLIGRSRYGWRGKTAIQWTVSGFVLLLLAYFGSKLVLKLILNR